MNEDCGSASGSTPTIIDGRFDIPADTPALPSRPILTNWIEGCPNQNLDVDAYAADTNNICKNCLYAFSFLSITPSTADAGVKACARDFCGECNTEELVSFFDCGYGISNAVDESAIPDSSIRTPPPSNAAIDKSVYDLGNCPSIYPQSSTNCIMIRGYEFKKCIYYVCECSEDEPVWNSTGTITNKEFIVETEDLEVTIEKVVLPTTVVVVSQIEGSEEEAVVLLCPIATPIIGNTCSTGDFESIECCYNDLDPYPNTLGTVTCTCSDGGNGGFHCQGGSLSTCTIPEY